MIVNDCDESARLSDYYKKYQPSRRNTQLIRSDSRASFLKLSHSPEREFERTTINELQTQHSWLSSLSSFLFPSLGPFNFSLFPFLLLASPSLPLSLSCNLFLYLFLSLSGELSRECHRDAPASCSLSLSLFLSFSLPLFHSRLPTAFSFALSLSLFFTLSSFLSPCLLVAHAPRTRLWYRNSSRKIFNVRYIANGWFRNRANVENRNLEM